MVLLMLGRFQVYLTGSCSLQLTTLFSSLRYHLLSGCLQMTTKVPVCADVWVLSFFCAVQSYVTTENWYFVPAVYRTFRETGPAEVLDYVLKVLRTYHR